MALTFRQEVVLFAFGLGEQAVLVWTLRLVLAADEHAEDGAELDVEVHRAAMDALRVLATIQRHPCSRVDMSDRSGPNARLLTRFLNPTSLRSVLQPLLLERLLHFPFTSLPRVVLLVLQQETSL